MRRRARTLCAGLVLGLFLAGCSSPPPPPPSLVFISLDTVRRDQLPTYGYERPTAPATHRLARRSVVFWNAFAQDTNTNPSHTSMFTGLYPHVHGNRSNAYRLAPERITLSQILSRAGFKTAAFVSSLTMQGELTGLSRGFDVYDDLEKDAYRRDGRVTVDNALAWMAERRADERYFLLVHLYDAHAPYQPPEPYAGMFRSSEPGPLLKQVQVPHLFVDEQGEPMGQLNAYVDRYDALIRYADDQLARLLERIDLRRTVVVIVADHGETLGERFHQLDHGCQVFDEQIRIPMVIHAPGFRPRRVEAPVETVSLLPTLLELLGVPLPTEPEPQGGSLVPLMRGETPPWPDKVFSSARAETRRHTDRSYLLDEERRIHTVRSERWKLISYPGVSRDYLELYDLASDPAELHNLAEQQTEVRDELLAILDDWLEDSQPSPAPEVDPEVLERLRQLGYVGD